MYSAPQFLANSCRAARVGITTARLPSVNRSGVPSLASERMSPPAIDAVDRGSREQRGEGSRRERRVQWLVWTYMVPSCWRNKRRSSTVSQRIAKTSSQHANMFCKFLTNMWMCLQTEVSRRVALCCWLGVCSHQRENAHTVQTWGDWWEAFLASGLSTSRAVPRWQRRVRRLRSSLR